MSAQYRFNIALLDVKNLNYGLRPLASGAGYGKVFA